MNYISLILKTLQEAKTADMSTGVLNSVRSDKKISNSNWSRIPNALNFKIKLGEKSVLWLKALGISKRIWTQTFIMPGRNRGMNRYMEHQVRRLRMLKGNPEAYFRLSNFLIRNSKSFQVSAINHVFNNWHRNMPLNMIMAIYRRFKKITTIDPMIVEMDFKRVYIPKNKPGEWRPLGVPSYSWRLYLHMYSNFLYIFLEDHFLDTQHGFIPGRGTMTAWKQFFERKLYNYKYIMEIDLKKCFDQINHNYLMNRLLEGGVPLREAFWIMQINKSKPKLPQIRKLDESRHMHGPSEIRNKIDQWTESGVAQGSASGPLLAAYALIPFMKQTPLLKGKINWGLPETSLSYADDAIFFSNKPFSLLEPLGIAAKTSGIEINLDKSDWVKYDGKWEKSFTFLGLSYDGTTLSANTRKGSKLILAEEEKEWIIALEWFEDNHATYVPLSSGASNLNTRFGDTWDSIMKSRYWGLIQSRLYQGSWDTKELIQEFDFKYKEKSWCDIYVERWRSITKEMNVFNSSSFASESLFKILRGENGFVSLEVPEFPKPEKKKKGFYQWLQEEWAEMKDRVQ